MADDAAPKQRGRPFKPGQSGNPRGKPPGVRHAALLALDAIGAEGAADIMRAVVEAARGGDMRAADILLRRLWPERKGRPVRLALPAVETPGDIAAALGSIAGAVATCLPRKARLWPPSWKPSAGRWRRWSLSAAWPRWNMREAYDRRAGPSPGPA